MNDANSASEERSEMLDTPKSTFQRHNATRDTTIQTTCATLPLEALNDVQMSFTETGMVQPARPTKDTMDSMSSDFSKLRTMAPPPKGASGRDVMDFVKYQLDRIGREIEILDGLLLLGAGRTERLEGGVMTPLHVHYL